MGYLRGVNTGGWRLTQQDVETLLPDILPKIRKWIAGVRSVRRQGDRDG
jgi:hypothetical protein